MAEESMDIIPIQGPGNFQFTAIPVAELEEDEYTLVVIADDVSPSTEFLRQPSCDAKKVITEACQDDNCPTSEKLLLRNTIFGSHVKESHGFKLVNSIDLATYNPESTVGGSTCLFDATLEAISSIRDYAKILDNQDFKSNGIVFIITDGMNNTGTIMNPAGVAEVLHNIRMMEELESIKVILIGINDPNTGWSTEVEKSLEDFEKYGKLDQLILAKDATPQKLAKIAEFVSQSIQSQSQSLGTGGPSVSLTF